LRSVKGILERFGDVYLWNSSVYILVLLSRIIHKFNRCNIKSIVRYFGEASVICYEINLIIKHFIFYFTNYFTLKMVKYFLSDPSTIENMWVWLKGKLNKDGLTRVGKLEIIHSESIEKDYRNGFKFHTSIQWIFWWSGYEETRRQD